MYSSESKSEKKFSILEKVMFLVGSPPRGWAEVQFAVFDELSDHPSLHCVAPGAAPHDTFLSWCTAIHNELPNPPGLELAWLMIIDEVGHDTSGNNETVPIQARLRLYGHDSILLETLTQQYVESASAICPWYEHAVAVCRMLCVMRGMLKISVGPEKPCFLFFSGRQNVGN